MNFTPSKSFSKFKTEDLRKENTLSDFNTPTLDWVNVNTPTAR